MTYHTCLIVNCLNSLYYEKRLENLLVQLQISTETMLRMEKISGISHARDGDFLVNQTIDILEKKIRER